MPRAEISCLLATLSFLSVGLLYMILPVLVFILFPSSWGVYADLYLTFLCSFFSDPLITVFSCKNIHSTLRKGGEGD